MSQQKLYIPPPERSLDVLRLLGVELKNGPPKNWQKYEDLLAGRLFRLAKDQRSRAGLVNELVNEDLLDEDLGNDLNLVMFLLASERYGQNHLVTQSLLYQNESSQRKKELLQNAEKDPLLKSLDENQRLDELRSVSLWEWWDLLR